MQYRYKSQAFQPWQTNGEGMEIFEFGCTNLGKHLLQPYLKQQQ